MVGEPQRLQNEKKAEDDQRANDLGPASTAATNQRHGEPDQGNKWVSSDGLTWQRAIDSPTFSNARVWGVAANGSGLVAVGLTGPTDAPGPTIVCGSQPVTDLAPYGRPGPDAGDI
jgi:hypothetical protein